MREREKHTGQLHKGEDEAARNVARSAAFAGDAPQRARRRRATLFVLCLAAATAAFGLLAFFAKRDAYFPLDLRITRFIQAQDGTVASVMKAVSWAGYAPQSVMLVAAAAALLYLPGLRWEAAVSVLAAALEELLNAAVKAAVHRPRPGADLVHVFGAMLTGYSFPSGHVMFYTCWFGFLWFLAYTLLKASWFRTLLLAAAGGEVLLVGLSRVYLGEHWASDAAGAYLLGGLELIGVIQFYRWGKDRFRRFRPSAGGDG